MTRKTTNSKGRTRATLGALAGTAVAVGTAVLVSATPATADATAADWPTATGDQDVTETIEVSGTFDGELVRYGGIGSGDQEEGQDPIFRLEDGAVLKNVILGEDAGDGVHCDGTCTLQNVWWEDVGEDAATLKGNSSDDQTMTVDGGGARNADDKVFQHNGPGNFVIKNFQVEDFGKLYRSCGNCSTQYDRHVTIQDVTVTAPGKSLAGINSNLGDTATISGVTILGDDDQDIAICEEYEGVTDGEPEKISEGPSDACRYSESDISYQ
ncbi:pectate lyase [Isoptericola sp. NPDC019482]|uniref:pectate lyase n=1 Tax=Isoptericola sp. NPDC019482 TaxID=3154688 RepID=UPI0034978ADA